MKFPWQALAITGLESTCTILGLTDTGLFWTRVHPSGMIQTIVNINDALFGQQILTIIHNFTCQES